MWILCENHILLCCHYWLHAENIEHNLLVNLFRIVLFKDRLTNWWIQLNQTQESSDWMQICVISETLTVVDMYTCTLLMRKTLFETLNQLESIASWNYLLFQSTPSGKNRVNAMKTQPKHAELHVFMEYLLNVTYK